MRRAACLTVTCSMLAAASANAAPVVRVSPEGAEAVAARVAMTAEGTAYVMWVEKGAPQPGRGHASADDLYVAAWTRGAAAPGPAVRVNHAAGEAKSSPVIRAQIEVGADGTVHVLYPANARSPVNGKPVIDVRYVRSRDGGRTFSQSVTLNSPSLNDLSASSHSDIAAAATFPALALGPEGRVYAFWLDSRHVANAEDPSDVYAAVSRDGGATWQADRRLFGGSVCECCQPVALATAGGVLLASRNVYPDGYRDPIVTRLSWDLEVSPDPARIGAERWKLDGCPMKSVALAAAGERVAAAWYSEADRPAGVWFTSSDDGGRSFAAGYPLHPSAEMSDAPVVARSGDRIQVAWHAKLGGVKRVYGSVSTDGGRTFAPPQALSPEGEAAGNPAIAADTSVAVVAWQQGGAVYASRWLATRAP